MDDCNKGFISKSMVYCISLYMAALNVLKDLIKFISLLPIRPIGSNLFKNITFYFAAQNRYVMRILEYFSRNRINFLDDLVDKTMGEPEDFDGQALCATLFQGNADAVGSGQVPIEDINPFEINDVNNGIVELSQQYVSGKGTTSSAVENVETHANENRDCSYNSNDISNSEVEDASVNDKILCSNEAKMNVCQKMSEIKLDSTGCDNICHDDFKSITEQTSVVKMKEVTIYANNEIATTSISNISLHTNETGQNKIIEDNENIFTNVAGNTDIVIIEEKCDNIFDAVKKESLEKVLIFINECVEIDATDENKNTLVHIAAARGDVDVLKILLDKGAKLEPINIYGNAPIHAACEHGNVHVVEEFLERGINIGIMDNMGNTSIHLTATHNHLELFKLLLDKGANIKQANKNGETCLHLAVKNGSQLVVELFLDPKYEGVLDLNEEIKCNGNTPLIVAIEMQHYSIFNLLLAANVDVNIKNKNGETALHTAVRTGLTSFIAPLLQANIDVNIQNNEGETAVFYTSDASILELLNENGLDLKLANIDGETVLHNAAKCGYVHIIQYLLRKQLLDGDLCTWKNETALYIAASHGHDDVIELLLTYIV